MLQTLADFLSASPLALLTLVIALGYSLGEVRLPGNFRFGMAAILFVGLGFGMADTRFSHVIPEMVQMFGLTIFIYCVGLEAGPGFFRSMGRISLKVNLLAMLCITVAAAACYLFFKFSLGSQPLLAGLFCGLLNNTPALAAATESVRSINPDPNAANAVVVGYGIAYPFSLIALLVLYHFLCRKAYGPKAVAPVIDKPTHAADTLKVLHLPPGKDHWTPAEITEATGLLLSRVFHTDTKAEVIHSGTQIHTNARVIAIGSPEQLKKGAELLGRFSAGTFETRQKGFSVHRYAVSNPALAGKTVGEVNAHLEGMDAVLTRLRRGDVELSVNPEIKLAPGDRVKIVGSANHASAIKEYIGDSLHALGSQGSITFVLGIFLGLILGAVPIAIPGLSSPLKLGSAGGPLVMALILGYLGRTGPMTWTLPISNNLTLRNLGIAIFFAAVGCRAGSGLSAVFNAEGALLVLAAIGTTLLVHILLWWLLKRVGVCDLAAFLGHSAGLQTQPAALTFASHRAPGDTVPISYAMVFPLALVIKIILAQILVLA